MEISIFTNKISLPTNTDLLHSLDKTYVFWQMIRDYCFLKYPDAIEEWNYPGEKYGWSFRIKDKKRAIVYLLPRDGFFKVALVFGQKATDAIMASEVSAEIKSELQSAKVYAEGRGIRITILDEKLVADIKRLIDIKIKVS
jgi:hypothetical protein